MKINENKKLAKLCDELLTFLLKKMYTKINIDLNVEQTRATVILSVADITQNDLEHMVDAMASKRNPSMEEYGWELLGTSENSNELELVGMCFNEFEYRKEGNLTIMTLVRYL